MVYCTACDLPRSVQPGNDEKCTSLAMKRMKHGLRIMLRDRSLGEDSVLKTQRQRFSKNRMNQGKQKILH